MKYTIIALFSTLLVACNQKPSAAIHTELRMPVTEVIKILKDHLPENAANKVKSKPTHEEQYDLELTTDQFNHLQFDFINKLKDHAGATYSYDRFDSGSTTFKEGFSSFSISLGKGMDYHYIVTGSFVLVNDHGKVVVWIKPTRG